MADAQGQIRYAVIDVSSSGATIVAGVDGTRTKIVGAYVSSSANSFVQLLSSGTATATLVPMHLVTLPAAVIPQSRDGWGEAVAGASITMTKTGTATIAGVLVYQQSKVT